MKFTFNSLEDDYLAQVLLQVDKRQQKVVIFTIKSSASNIFKFCPGQTNL